MKYEDFYDIAAYEYGNWDVGYTQKEIESYAHIYYSDFKLSKKKGRPTRLIQMLLILLLEDGKESCNYWYWAIMSEIVR